MGQVDSKHRPILSGVGIYSIGPLPTHAPGDDHDQLGSGTLTAVARRDSDGKQVLVTNLHVLGAYQGKAKGGSHASYHRDMPDGRILTAGVLIGKGELNRKTLKDILYGLEIPLDDFKDAVA